MSLTPEERAFVQLMRDAHLAGDHDLPELFDRYAVALGVAPVVVYLVDLQLRVLVPFVGTAGAREEDHLDPLDVGTTLAGRAFQHVEVITHPADDGGQATRVWLPLLNGTERLGLMSCVVATPDALDGDGGALRARLKTFAAVAAELVMTKTMYGDTIVRLRRTSAMGLAAEMQWAVLPPLTYANHRITISGGIEPAYAVGGDTLDYAADPRGAHFAIFDGMGHGLRSAQLATLAVSAYRNARRGRQSLAQTLRLVDEAVASAFDGDGYLTGQLAELDTDTGALGWINAGHPDPLLLREGRLIKELHTEPTLPIGLGHLGDDQLPTIGAETLEPGDLVLFYSDGVVEARSPAGEFFGAERLVDVVIRHLAAGLPTAETTRRVIGSLLEHQQGQLDDDATLLLVQFMPDHPDDLRP